MTFRRLDFIKVQNNLLSKGNFIMKFSKLAILSLSIFVAASAADARTVNPIVDKRGNPVQDHRGNCARTKWLADQCCDPCGYPTPPAPEPLVVEKQRRIEYIDLIRQSIYFNIDKDNIDAIDEQRMNDVINEINKSVAIRDVKLVGYADRFATNEYNIDLSKRRATNALNYFRGKGYFNDLKVGFGFFGEEKPVTNCPLNIPVLEQVACLQADRRVDIEVEVLRERFETYTETVDRAMMPDAPAYPRPGTTGVEVYSRPVDPAVLQQTVKPMEMNPPVQEQIQYQSPGTHDVPANSIDMLRPQQ